MALFFCLFVAVSCNWERKRDIEYYTSVHMRRTHTTCKVALCIINTKLTASPVQSECGDIALPVLRNAASQHAIYTTENEDRKQKPNNPSERIVWIELESLKNAPRSECSVLGLFNVFIYTLQSPLKTIRVVALPCRPLLVRAFAFSSLSGAWAKWSGGRSVNL